ncbi:MAG: FecR domain-containing protein [Pedobacter sp.]|uniref:FecR family protein n=1 Tax=Pedobacter sp. TaxID=1411316 RepID=UPI0028085A1E|nr:FecR domain-containing protein [Pedobacter sp.]MDQ8006616.1 FecR domain-containing protein [Pedobacter sp.]
MNNQEHQMTHGTNNRLAELFKKYVDKTITEEEYAELFVYIRNPETKEQVLAFMDEHNRKVQSDVLVHEVDWDGMYANITNPKKLDGRKRMPIWKYAAAAAVLLVTVFTLYYTVQKTAENKPLAYHNDILPGGDKATLTLADGSQIVLDNKNTGQVATEGAISIETDANGQIVYLVKGDSEAESQKINTLSTPAGGKFSVVLSDGSKVWLNATSSIKFPAAFAKDERRVEIKGEAYFEIEKDSSRPFYVKNGSSEIKVLGTHFNVMAYPDEYRSELTLLEGSVQFTKSGNSELLKPGKQILYTETSTETKQRDANIEEVMAWKNDLFVFNDTNIDEIMKELMRWYDVKIKYEGEKPDISFTGIIPRNANVSKVLKALELTGDVVFGIESNVITCEKKMKK